MRNLSKIGLILGPSLFILFQFNIVSGSQELSLVLGVAAWMISWWITEAVSISVTALLPLALFPLLGIASMKEVSTTYGSPIIFLFFGGFVMAIALEKVNLHRRIALSIIKFTGSSADRTILGFMIASAFLSMWISNTATAVVMLPIATSIIPYFKGTEQTQDRNFALSLMLGIAASCNVGGIATIIGTPPNTVLVGMLESEFGRPISFFNWMSIGLPFTVLMITLIYLVMVKWIYRSGIKGDAVTTIAQEKLHKLGVIKTKEKYVIGVFATIIALWMFRTHLNARFDFLHLSDAGIAVLGAVILFTLPVNFKSQDFIINWDDTKNIPWGILILFGGGTALARELKNVGVVDQIGSYTSTLDGISTTGITFILILTILFMTEIMSNVALVTVIIPVVAGVAKGMGMDILHLLIPVTMAASCAFMLPMATPPNAVVFATGHIKVSQMIKLGLILNTLSVILITLFAQYLIPIIF